MEDPFVISGIGKECSMLNVQFSLQYFNLVAQEVPELIPFADQVGLAIHHEHLGRLKPRVEIGRHFKTISPGIAEYQAIPFPHLTEGTVPGKGVGFANVTNHGIFLQRPGRIADVLYVVIGIVEHGTDEVVETAVHTYEGGGGGLFDHIDLCHKVAAFTHQEFTGLEPYLQGPAAGIGMGSECFAYLLCQQVDIGFHIPFLVGHFKTTTQVDKLQLFKVGYYIKQYFNAFYKNIHILDLTAGMDVKIADTQVVFFDDCQYLVDLVDGDTKLTFIVTGRYLEVAACHDVGAQPKPYGIGMPIGLAKFVEVGQAIDIDDDAQFFGLGNLAEGNTIGSIQDPFRWEAGMQGQFGFIDGAAVYIGAERAYIFKNIHIGQCLTGIKENGIAFTESRGELLILLFYFFRMVYVQGGAVFGGQLGQVFFCELL